MTRPEIRSPVASGPASAPADAVPVHDTMRRLQIGIAGVVTVLLLVGLAGVIGDRARENAAKDVATATAVRLPGAETGTGSAPLEDLGVQPVSKEDNAGAAIKVPQAPPSVATVPDLEPDPELARARQSKR